MLELIIFLQVQRWTEMNLFWITVAFHDGRQWYSFVLFRFNIFLIPSLTQILIALIKSIVGRLWELSLWLVLTAWVAILIYSSFTTGQNSEGWRIRYFYFIGEPIIMLAWCASWWYTDGQSWSDTQVVQNLDKAIYTKDAWFPAWHKLTGVTAGLLHGRLGKQPRGYSLDYLYDSLWIICTTSASKSAFYKDHNADLH